MACGDPTGSPTRQLCGRFFCPKVEAEAAEQESARLEEALQEEAHKEEALKEKVMKIEMEEQKTKAATIDALCATVLRPRSGPYTSAGSRKEHIRVILSEYRKRVLELAEERSKVSGGVA